MPAPVAAVDAGGVTVGQQAAGGGVTVESDPSPSQNSSNEPAANGSEDDGVSIINPSLSHTPLSLVALISYTYTYMCVCVEGCSSLILSLFVFCFQYYWVLFILRVPVSREMNSFG